MPDTIYTAIRRGHAEKWNFENPVLDVGITGYESNTGRFKIGDGITHWNDLPYFVQSGEALAAHEARLDLHTSGQRTGLAINETGTATTILTTNTPIPVTSIDLPQINRPQVLEGKMTIKFTANMTAGTVTSIGLYLVDELGNFLESDMAEFNSAQGSSYQTIRCDFDIEANTPAHTYHLETVRIGSTTGTVVVLNGAISPSHRSRLRARAA